MLGFGQIEIAILKIHLPLHVLIAVFQIRCQNAIIDLGQSLERPKPPQSAKLVGGRDLFLLHLIL